MSKTVVAIFNSKEEAENAADQLVTNGFTKSNIDLTFGDENADDDDDENGISRFFKNLFGNDDEEHERYSAVARRRYVVHVRTNSGDQADRAADLLDDYGAINVDEQYKTEYADGEDSLVDDNLDDTLMDGKKTIPVIEEDIEIGKKEVTTGGVRIKSRIVERPVEETLRLREEHINVDRKKVDRAATDDELRDFQDKTVEMKERAEVPDVQKKARVTEEVNIRKDVDHRDETIRDTVRKTEVDTDDIDEDDDIDEIPR